MNFKNNIIKNEYRSPDDNVINDFYIPLLKNAVLYKRAVGFFSSSSLIEITKGISGLVKNNGRIQIVASPELSKDDIEAIDKGYDLRDILMDSFNNLSSTSFNYFEKERLNMLANLIADDRLDIKIAFTLSHRKYGIYHEKMGLLYDNEDNIVAFSGSMNETGNAFNNNYEVVDVFTSWSIDSDRVYSKEAAFNRIWQDTEPNIKVLDFTEKLKTYLIKYKKTIINYSIDQEEFHKDTKNLLISVNKEHGPRIPEKFTDVRDYQKVAYEKWLENNKKGLFAMATGTGKTVTALYCALEDYNSNKRRNCNNKYQVIVLVPTKTLVNQWVDEVRSFHFFSIIKAYSENSKWKTELNTIINDKKYSNIESDFFIISTYRSFINSYYSHFSKLNKSTLLIADEVHNMGSPGFLKIIDDVSFDKRIGLSATPKRIYSPENSNKISEFLNTEYPYTFNFSMKEAIDKKILTEYHYKPIKVSLTAQEFEEYIKISKEIRKFSYYNDSKSLKINSNLERLLIQRKRIINGAEKKKKALIGVIEDIRKNKSFTLEYCIVYAPSGSDYFNEDIVVDNDIKRIIFEMSKLVNDYFPKISQNKYISESLDKKNVIKSFSEGYIDLLFAINCLDEGVDIPQAKIGIFTSSTGNPRQYIQRRGRLLRKHPDKDFAYIYDMIVVPPKSGNTYDEEKKLVINELKRVKYFMELSYNFTHFDLYFKDICEYYKISYRSIDIDEEML